jgi:hypothetical protein
MMNQLMSGKPIDGQSVVDGTAVFDLAGENVGTAVKLDPPVDCLVVQKGWFAHELYVPFSYIVSQDESGLFLNLSKQDLKDDRWKVPPPSSGRATAPNPPVAVGPHIGSEQFMPAPPLESLLRDGGQPVGDGVVIEDEQLVAVALVSDALDVDADGATTDLNARK